ncbi:MAG: alpha/beta hydrolase [Bacteroidota bacterium]
MKKNILIISFLLVAGWMKAQDITGNWAGFLNVQGAKLKIVFHIRSVDGKLNATFDSPDQNALGLKIDETSLSGNKLSLNAKSMGILYEGLVSKKFDSIMGTWIQGGGRLPLDLAREKQDGKAAVANPFESDIILKTATGDINGTLTLPLTKEKVPVVLIIAGSGPTDRDGNSPPALMNKSNCYKMLAEELRKNGVASVRYDKRGIAGSAGSALKESDLRLDNYISDAQGWIVMLNGDVRFSKIIVAGHSEGSLIGIVACSQAKAKGFISIAGSGRPANEILREQFSSLPQTEKDRIFPLLDKLQKGDTLANVPSDLNSFFRPSIQPYLISWFRYDPQSEIKKLKIPVMIIQGDMDIQVSLEDAGLLAKADPQSSLKIIKGMNHVLKDTDTKDKAEQITKVYTNPDLPLDKQFGDEVVRFVHSVQ